jgi:hypothetical protein
VKRLAITFTVLAVALTACAGASPDTQSQPPADSEAPPDENAARDTNTAAPGSQPDGSVDNPLAVLGRADNTAVVVIGGQRYEFANLYCVTIAGALGAESLGGDPQVNIDLPPQDWETSGSDWDPPSIRVQVDDPEHDYKAGGNYSGLSPDQSRVTSFDSDGHHATGTAAFFDDVPHADPTSVTGTFEVACPN